MKEATVFVAHDYKIPEILDGVADKLQAKGIKVIRGPETKPGVRLKYEDAQLKDLFGSVDVAMFSSRSICDKRVIDAAPHLKGIVNPTIAVDTVDVPYANEKGIIIGNGAIEENYIGMAEATAMLIMMLMYDPLKSMRLMRGEIKEPSTEEHWARLMHKKTLGILGFGRIGRGVAERFSTWNMDIIAYDPYISPSSVPNYVKLVDLNTFYKMSDIIGVFLVVTEETRNMINDESFSKMKTGVRFVNTSRGQVVDEAALVRALNSGKVAGAALDTFQVEPLPADSPLRKMENVILTPHIVGHTYENQTRLSDNGVTNILAILNGELPPYCVNPQIVEKWKSRISKERIC